MFQWGAVWRDSVWQKNGKHVTGYLSSAYTYDCCAKPQPTNRGRPVPIDTTHTVNSIIINLLTFYEKIIAQ